MCFPQCVHLVSTPRHFLHDFRIFKNTQPTPLKDNWYGKCRIVPKKWVWSEEEKKKMKMMRIKGVGSPWRSGCSSAPERSLWPLWYSRPPWWSPPAPHLSPRRRVQHLTSVWKKRPDPPFQQEMLINRTCRLKYFLYKIEFIKLFSNRGTTHRWAQIKYKWKGGKTPPVGW